MAVFHFNRIMLILLQIHLIFLIKLIQCNGIESAGNNGELKAVVVVYRHGDRTPIRPYPNDPYKNASYWPVGFGQLTNLGKMQEYELGKWLRARYVGNFLSEQFNVNEIYIQSTDVDRTLMSAEANLAGFYPPENQQIWNKNLTWQPIPIHTRPELNDPILAMKQTCPKYQQLLNNLLTKDPYFRNITRKNHDLYAYLSRYSGLKITSLETLEYLYNTLKIEQLNNFTLPQWTKNVFPDKMEFSAQLSFATGCYTEQLARLKTGLWFNELIGFFKNHTIGQNKRKMLVYSGHDITIANLLKTMGAFDLHCPPYSSTILFELYSNNNDYSIEIYYKNSTTNLQRILPKGCNSTRCSLSDFIQSLNGVVLTFNQWLIECQLNTPAWPWLSDNDNRFDNFVLFVIIAMIISCLFILLFIIVVVVKCCRNKQHNTTNYQQLPNDEVA